MPKRLSSLRGDLRLSKSTATEADDRPALVIRDFTASRISVAMSAAVETPVLTIGCESEAFILSFDYRETQLDADQALTFMTELPSGSRTRCKASPGNTWLDRLQKH